MFIYSDYFIIVQFYLCLHRRSNILLLHVISSINLSQFNKAACFLLFLANAASSVYHMNCFEAKGSLWSLKQDMLVNAYFIKAFPY